jgi:hypothetical protein
MNNLKYYIFVSLFIFLINNYSKGQNASFINECNELIKYPFIPDGHDYSAEITQDGKGEFKTTFYGGSTYRIVTCSNLPQGKVIFTIYDNEKNKLFCNKNYNYSSYWDFTFRSTIDCIIEVKFESEIAKKAIIKLIIAFKN